jgi:hypothetical protein
LALVNWCNIRILLIARCNITCIAEAQSVGSTMTNQR